MSIAPEGYQLASNPRIPTSISPRSPIDWQKTLLGQRGDEGEVVKSGERPFEGQLQLPGPPPGSGRSASFPADGDHC